MVFPYGVGVVTLETSGNFSSEKDSINVGRKETP